MHERTSLIDALFIGEAEGVTKLSNFIEYFDISQKKTRPTVNKASAHCQRERADRTESKREGKKMANVTITCISKS